MGAWAWRCGRLEMAPGIKTPPQRCSTGWGCHEDGIGTVLGCLSPKPSEKQRKIYRNVKGSPFFPSGLRAEMKPSVAGHSQLAWDLSEAFAHHNTSQKCWKQSSAFLLIAGHKALASTSSSGSAPRSKWGCPPHPWYCGSAMWRDHPQAVLLQAARVRNAAQPCHAQVC